MNTLKQLTLLLLFPACAQAQQFKSGKTVLISRPVHEDLYIAAGTVIVNAPVYGDLVLAGGTVTLNDSVANDVMVAGGEIIINGAVGDDVRIGGGKVYLASTVGGDVVVSGGTVTLQKTATVNGSFVSSSGNARLDGVVNGFVKANGGMITLNGRVLKWAELTAEAVEVNGTVMGWSRLAAQRLTVGSDAAFYNNVRYWSETEHANLAKAVKKGKAVNDASLMMGHGSREYLGFASLFALVWYIGAIWVLIVFIQFVFGGFLQRLSPQYLVSNMVYSIGYGFLFFVVSPVALVLALVTLVGIPLALILSALFVLLLLLATVITSLVLANLANAYFYGNHRPWRSIWLALAIFCVLKLLGLVPVLGWLITILAVLFAFGAILLKVLRKKETVAPPNPA